MDELKDTLSTMLTEEAGSVSAGAGDPPPEVKEEPAKPAKELSVADVLRQEAKAQKEAEKAEKADSQAKDKAEEPVDVKQEKADSAKDENEEEPDGDDKPEGKEVAADKKADDSAAATKDGGESQSEGDFLKVPSRLLPKERENWGNVPHSAKKAIHRFEGELASMEAELGEKRQFHESLRKFDDMAKAAGIPISEAMERYVSMDQKLANNFGQGLAEIAQSFGKNPTAAVAEFMRAAGVQPQQLGAYLQGQPAQPQQPQQPQQRQADPAAQAALQRVEQLERQLQQQQVEARQSRVETEIIAPFRAANPRYDELAGDIAFFLNSGKIPTSLSPTEKLEVAYDMAERINPSPVTTKPVGAEPAGKPASDAGKKSVRGAPATGISTEADFDNVTDLRDLLRKEARKLG